MIEVRDITKSYGPKRGVFNLSFSVEKGEVFGFLGPNGAGKTTTIRQLLGFIHPDEGEAFINGMPVFQDAHIIQQDLGYIAGEIAFFNHMRGDEFLDFQARMRKLTSRKRRDELIERFELNPRPFIRKMSKGMKQKLAIVAAFMHDPDIYILDEPTSGLDPLMQGRFVELIHNEKKRGKTILMSSHNFGEVERTCDRALIIKHGEKMALEDVKALKEKQTRIYLVTLEDGGDIKKLDTDGLEIVARRNNDLEISVSGDINGFLEKLAQCRVKSLDVKHQSLEEIFMDYYREEGANHE